MANPNPVPRKRVGEPRTVKMTLPEPVWNIIDTDPMSSKTAETIRLMLLAYLGLDDSGRPLEGQLRLSDDGEMQLGVNPSPFKQSFEMSKMDEKEDSGKA